jgi:hypothetical protein
MEMLTVQVMLIMTVDRQMFMACKVRIAELFTVR